jgi:cytochrome b involved in lipid metabolism
MSKELPLSLSQHGGSSMTAGSSSSQQDEEVMVKIRLEISRLQMLERGLAESSRAFTVNDSDEERQEKRRTRVRRTVTVLVGIAVLVGVVFGIMAIVKHMKDKDVKFAQANGGNTPTSLQQLEVHNTVEDCWLVLHGNVYDLTSYADRHPGGAFWITDQCGQDGTGLYDAFHPTSLLRTVRRFQTGPFVEHAGMENILDPVGAASDAPTGNQGNQETGSSQGDSAEDESGDEDEDGPQNTVQPTRPPTQAPSLGVQPPQEVDYSVCRPNCSVPLSELQRHNTVSDLWTAVYGVVYDLTYYASRHPGGSRVVVNMGGAVMPTSEFERYHRAQDVQKVSQYIVGNLA